LRRRLLPKTARKGRHALAVEIAFQAVADRFVQENARPAGAQHDGHRSRRGLDRGELEAGLARRLAREALPALVFQEPVEGHTAAAAVRPDLALVSVFRDDGDVEAGPWPHLADPPSRRPPHAEDH